MRSRGEGGSIKIVRRICLSHSAEKFVKEPFSVSLMLGINRKNIWQNRDSNLEPIASEPCCPNPTAAIYF